MIGSPTKSRTVVPSFVTAETRTQSTVPSDVPTTVPSTVPSTVPTSVSLPVTSFDKGVFPFLPPGQIPGGRGFNFGQNVSGFTKANKIKDLAKLYGTKQSYGDKVTKNF